ncbi:MAG: hypothetical protein ABI903_00590 [Actinomycetota bacterium]
MTQLELQEIILAVAAFVISLAIAQAKPRAPLFWGEDWNQPLIGRD